MCPFSLEGLRRRPDVEAADLVAVDAADRLLLDTAADRLSQGDGVATINDSYGALTLGAAQLGHGRPVRVFQDGIVNERALALNAADLDLAGVYQLHALDARLFDGVRTVLLRLPRSLDELDEIAWTIAAHAQPDVQVLAAGRIKHMSVSMNAVLGRYFGRVTAGLGRQKSRVISVSQPLPVSQPRFPRTGRHDVGLERPLELRAYGATFGGAALDPGTGLLLPHLRGLSRPLSGSSGISGGLGGSGISGVSGISLISGGSGGTVVDLGCGNGAVSAYLALIRRELRVLASDQSASAVASTTATAAATGVADLVSMTRDDALSTFPDASVGAIVLNPPFHIGSTVHAGIAHKLFDACARVLASGGELWTVWNSYLRYRAVLERSIGPTRQLARPARFTVTCSTRRP